MARDSKGADVDRAVIDAGTIEKMSPFHQLIQLMDMDATAAIEDSSAFAGDDLNAILTAETESEIWDADERGPLNFQHLADCELQILDVHVKYSRGSNDEITTPFISPDGKKMYLIVTCVRLSDAGEKKHIRLPPVGEVFEANTSARYCVAKIMQFYRLGMIESQSGKTINAVVKQIDLGGDQAVLKLRPMPRRTVSA